MKTLSEIMADAHKLAKTFEGDYSARLSLALQIVWFDAKKLLEVKKTLTSSEISYLIANIHSNTIFIPEVKKDLINKLKQFSYKYWSIDIGRQFGTTLFFNDNLIKNIQHI